MPETATALAEYDIVVIGGGINGAGVARDAAMRGFSVALFEKDDFGSGSSSRTSKLVHGGIRYLEHGQLRLVWEACHERRHLLRLAPHLVRPQPFVLPVYRDSRFGPARLRLGMWLYDLLAAFRNVRPHRMLARGDAAAWCEGLRLDGLRGAALYYDAAMDDARLVLANVLAAREAGADVHNYTSVESLVLESGAVAGVEVRAEGRCSRVRARVCVACTGPWTNAFLARLSSTSPPVEATRGTHIVVRRISERAFTLAAGRDGRVFFVLPWLGLTLIGTTDIADPGDADAVAPSDTEIDYLIEEANRAFPSAALGRDDVLAVFAGLRPLLRSGGTASARSREHAVLEPVPGLLAVVGGKYTTYRAVAEAVVDRVQEKLGARRVCPTARVALPGGDVPWGAESHWNESASFRTAAEELARLHGLDDASARHLQRTYGSRAGAVAVLCAENAAWVEKLCPHHPHLGAEVAYAVRVEMARRLEDWFLRRSRTAFSACGGSDALEDVARTFGRELGWDETTRNDAITAYRAQLARIGLSRSRASKPAG